MQNSKRLTALAVVFVVVSGCSSQLQPHKVDISRSGDTESSVNVGRQSIDGRWTTKTYSLRLFLPTSPRQLDLTPLRVTATRSNGQPIRRARVRVELTMPSMSMPENITTLREAAPGVYSGSCRFSMAGEWMVKPIVDDAYIHIHTHSLRVRIH